MTAPYAEAAALAERIKPLSAAARIAVIDAAVIDQGGTLVPAMPIGNWGPHYAEISLLGISHTGDTTEAAVANWIKAALRAEKHIEVAA